MHERNNHMITILCQNQMKNPARGKKRQKYNFYVINGKKITKHEPYKKKMIMST
jgi:hypothetical protein